MYKLSVIIPIYNAEKYLKECLESVIRDIEDVEYILIDDGSKDKSRLIYSEYSNNPNVVIIKNENHGVSFTRNYGIKIARGEYIMFVDADDYLEEDWFNVIKKELDSGLDLIIFSKYYKNYTYNKVDLQKACLNYGNNLLKECSIMSPWSRIYRKDFLCENNIRFSKDIINGEDMLLNFEVISLTNKIKIVNEGFYIYRLNFGSATNNFNYNIFKSDIAFHLKLEKLVSNDENCNELKKSLTYLKINAIYIIAMRVSFSKEKDKSILINELIKKDLYKSEFTNYLDVRKDFPKFERLILDLIIRNNIKLAIIILNLKNKMKKILSPKEETIKLKKI